VVLGLLGKYKEAEDTYKPVYKFFGRKDPTVLTHLKNLAEVMGSQRNNKEAVRIYRLVLQRREGIYGIEHPETINSHIKLAFAL
jgi:hypothetical protein